MKALGVNGSPRKKWNTAALLEKALAGAASEGALTETVNLYDLTYKGCISCFACKVKGGKNYGRCGFQDGLTPLLEKAVEADILFLASPIYFGTVTGEMRSFQERLFFPFLMYTDPPQSLFTRKVRTGALYTFGASEALARERGFDRHVALNEGVMERLFGASESLCSYDTYQFDDYSKYHAPRFDPQEKAKRREEVFPLDCQKAFEMGARFARELR